MSRYYEPPSAIASGKIGRPLVGRNFDDAKGQLGSTEHLYVQIHTFFSEKIVCVDNRVDFENLYGQYNAGDLFMFNLFALSEEQHQSTV